MRIMNRRQLFRLQALDLAAARTLFDQWYFSAQAEQVIEFQRQHLAQLGPRCFGYQAVQIGANPQQALVERIMTQRRAVLAPGLGMQSPNGVCELAQLPFENDSVDVLYLNHVLEYAANPHWCLKEANRVLADHGSLIISGFNPWSLFGLYTYGSRFKSQSAWRKHQISVHRLEDWFGILGFDLHSLERNIIMPPGLSLPQRMLDVVNQWSLPIGSLYTLAAKKEVVRLTPIKPRWAGNKVADLVSLKPALLAKKTTPEGKSKR